MNVLLWVFQVALALLSLAGGAYKVFSFEAVSNMGWYHALPRGGWTALGVFEMACAVLLIVPAAVSDGPPDKGVVRPTWRKSPGPAGAGAARALGPSRGNRKWSIT